MGEHIIPSGWHDWNKKYAAENLVEYVEYHSKGPGSAAKERVKWSRILTDEEAEKYSISNILSGSDNWIPYISGSE
jgi:pectinesterase